MTLHPVFQGSFYILDPIIGRIGMHGSLTILLSLFTVLGA